MGSLYFDTYYGVVAKQYFQYMFKKIVLIIKYQALSDEIGFFYWRITLIYHVNYVE